MLTDDDFPDYFVDNNDEGSQHVAAPGQPVKAGDTIHFTDKNHGGSLPATSHSSHRTLGCIALLVIAAGMAIFYFRYLSPCVDDAVMEVYVTHVEKRGIFFKTYEAEIVEPERLHNISDTYTHPTSVTIANDSVAVRLSRMQGSGKTIRLRYRRYYGTLPWRGESKTAITAIDE